ncbi:MADS box transcription factor [Striga asiatica]|uniref:MADS box transcription factor n=1 Tax=Striga asiatica TaxID=4170 RepID=A0A5A7QIT7_STRAF|nr:MADS box transcription factor [Striga asiatica]
MTRTLSRYEQYTYSDKKNGTNCDDLKKNWYLEHPKLMARVELLQRNTRNYAGQDLDPLSMRELRSLEQQLNSALKRIRTKEARTMQDQHNKLVKEDLKEKAALQRESLPQNASQGILSTVGNESTNQTHRTESNTGIPRWFLSHKDQM